MRLLGSNRQIRAGRFPKIKSLSSNYRMKSRKCGLPLPQLWGQSPGFRHHQSTRGRSW